MALLGAIFSGQIWSLYGDWSALFTVGPLKGPENARLEAGQFDHVSVVVGSIFMGVKGKMDHF